MCLNCVSFIQNTQIWPKWNTNNLRWQAVPATSVLHFKAMKGFEVGCDHTHRGAAAPRVCALLPKFTKQFTSLTRLHAEWRQPLRRVQNTFLKKTLLQFLTIWKSRLWRLACIWRIRCKANRWNWTSPSHGSCLIFIHNTAECSILLKTWPAQKAFIVGQSGWQFDPWNNLFPLPSLPTRQTRLLKRFHWQIKVKQLSHGVIVKFTSSVPKMPERQKFTALGSHVWKCDLKKKHQKKHYFSFHADLDCEWPFSLGAHTESALCAPRRSLFKKRAPAPRGC